MSAVENLKKLIPNLGSYAGPEDFIHLSDDELSAVGIKKVAYIGATNEGDRRWGYDRQSVLNVDGVLVGVMEYYVTGDGESEGPSEWTFYPVEPRTTIEYVPV